MKRRSVLSRIQLALGALTALILVACGGESTLIVADGGIGGTGITSSGSITAKGSIVVNEVRYDTATSTILIDDSIGTEDDLLPGMIVRVDGRTLDGDETVGTAESVSYESLIRGPAESGSYLELTPRVKQVTVLGQPVRIEQGKTRFDLLNPALDAFDDVSAGIEGRILEVSGFENGSGAVLATFLSEKAPAFVPGETEVKVRAAVTASTAATIQLRGLSVDVLTNPLALDPLGGQVPNVGTTVEVRGSLFDGATLIAERVEQRTGGLGDNIPRVHLEGILTGLDIQTLSFQLGTQTVTYGLVDRLIGGTLSDLRNGQRIEVEGSIASGVLTAEKIEFDDAFRIEGNVLTVDPTTLSFTLDGITGLTIQADATLTEFDDLTGFSALSAGAHVEVRGRPDTAPDTLLAIQLKRTDTQPDPDLVVQAEPEQVDETTGILVILGQSIDTSTFADSAFRQEDSIIGRTEFFQRLQDQSAPLVKAQGTLSPQGAAQWQQIEIEN